MFVSAGAMQQEQRPAGGARNKFVNEIGQCAHDKNRAMNMAGKPDKENHGLHGWHGSEPSADPICWFVGSRDTLSARYVQNLSRERMTTVTKHPCYPRNPWLTFRLVTKAQADELSLGLAI